VKFKISYKMRLITICLLVLLLLSSCAYIDKQVSKKVSYNITKGSIYKNFVQRGGSYLSFETMSTESINYFFESEKYN
jgi:hypothetical protein